MYLSQLLLRPDAPQTWRWLGNCYELHREIMRGFPQGTAPGRAREEFGVLFRVETPRPGSPIRVLVQSQHLPDWSPLVGPAYAGPVLGPKSMDALIARLVPGAHFRFRLRANPTRRVHPNPARPDGEWNSGVRHRRERPESVGKRVALVREEERIAWLARRGREQDGFELANVRLTGGDAAPAAVRADPAGDLRGFKPAGSAGGHQLTLTAAQFEGELIVTDRERFLHALTQGIGPGKAFGLGLLSIAPVDADM